VSGRAIAIGVAGVILPAIGLVLVVRSCSHAAVSGELAVLGDGGWRAPLNRCRSGELQSFTGVELGRDSDSKTLVRALIDPDRGTIVEISRPTGGVPIRLTPANCPDLRLELRTAGHDGDGAALLDGRVVARCTPPDGPPVQLDAWWRRCGPS
jgi:hypothetical protein